MNKENYGGKIVTKLQKYDIFYKETDPKHQNFFNDNPSHGMCVYVIQPKVKKIEENFP